MKRRIEPPRTGTCLSRLPQYGTSFCVTQARKVCLARHRGALTRVRRRKEVTASLSKRVAMRLRCLSLQKNRYRRVHVLLRREVFGPNQKKTQRIHRELGLQLRNKTPKRRVKAKLRDDRKVATQPNETWATGFVHDQLAMVRKIRVLTVVDTFTRYVPTRTASIKARSSYPAISIYGPTRTASRRTSQGWESQRTTRSSKPSMGAFARNA